MKIKVALICLSIFCFSKGFAQEVITIPFNDYFNKSESGYSFCMLVSIDKDSITFFGKKHKVVYPSDFNFDDTAFAHDYFTGWDSSSLESSTGMLIGNYKSGTPTIYVDINHNMDFSDDGEPVSFKSDSTLVMYRHNKHNSEAKFPIYLFHKNYPDSLKEKVYNSHITMGPLAKSNDFVPLDFWFATQRMNTRIANTEILNSKVMLGIHDYNCNGFYDDKEGDRILIGDYNSQLISSSLQRGAIEIKDTTLIVIKGQLFEIVEIESTGKFIKIKKSSLPYDKPLGIGDKLPEITINWFNGTVSPLHEIQDSNKMMLVDVWGLWCKGCLTQLPELEKLYEEHQDQLQIIGLNYGDKASSIQSHFNKQKPKWKQHGYASQEVINKLQVDSFPNYLLIDANGQILGLGLTLTELESHLKEQRK